MFQNALIWIDTSFLIMDPLFGGSEYPLPSRNPSGISSLTRCTSGKLTVTLNAQRNSPKCMCKHTNAFFSTFTAFSGTSNINTIHKIH